jgi:hypothetical protein
MLSAGLVVTLSGFFLSIHTRTLSVSVSQTLSICHRLSVTLSASLCQSLSHKRENRKEGKQEGTEEERERT